MGPNEIDCPLDDKTYMEDHGASWQLKVDKIGEELQRRTFISSLIKKYNINLAIAYARFFELKGKLFLKDVQHINHKEIEAN